MINVEEIREIFESSNPGNQKKLLVASPLGVYCGISTDGYMRLSFLSKKASPRMVSTRLLRVTQGAESEHAYWTCFDLLQRDAKKVFYTFCESIIESVSDKTDEWDALNTLKNRYVTWKTMFQNSIGHTISPEKLQGLYGELYYLKNRLIDIYGIDAAINGWSGPDNMSKDYSFGTEWYEIKTVGANVSTVSISSLAQLTSDYPGHLVVIRAEKMSDEFDNGESCVGELFRLILSKINNETTSNMFMNKISEYGFDISDESFETNFDVKSVNSYLVDNRFPRLTAESINRYEICDVKYSLYINALNDYLEG